MATCLLALGVSCGTDDHCGPVAISESEVTAAAAGEIALSFSGFASSANNDCTASPGGPTSLTIEGRDPSASPSGFTLCLPAPDRIGDGPIALDNEDLVQVIGLFAHYTTPTRDVALDRSRPVNGTITFHGFCGNGVVPEGFSISIDGQVSLTYSVGDEMNSVDATLTGDAIVEAR